MREEGRKHTRDEGRRKREEKGLGKKEGREGRDMREIGRERERKREKG